ncbi:MAG TPA: c-type cytochrome [Acidimicrobiales bacterium]|nr:c-type cytochrome [Acidimicrobiales bacterium]
MRAKLRVRFLLPGLLVAGVAVVGLLTSGATASEAASPPAAPAALKSATSAEDSPITFHLPPSSYIAPGQTLFELNCSSCHGVDASGTARAPNLQGLGPATVDFWVSTGRMPLAVATAQPVQKPARFDRTQTLQIVAFVNSLAPAAPDYPSGIPSVDLSAGNLAEGNSLFVLNCAGCHTITGAGDALSNGFFAPSLHKIYPRQIVEAIRTGPTQMPHFGPGNLSNQQVTDIVRYVTSTIQHPTNRGGLGLGGIGPVAEGFIGLLFGVGGIMLVAFWLGDRK